MSSLGISEKTNSPHNLNQCTLLPQLEQLEVVFAALTKERHLQSGSISMDRWISCNFGEFFAS